MYLLKRIKALRGGDCVTLSLTDAQNEKNSLMVNISAEQFETFRRGAGGDIYDGLPVDESTLEMLESMQNLYEAVTRGITILSYGACSERRMAVKLEQKGFDRAAAHAAAAYLSDHGYIDDKAQALAFAKTCLRKLYGPSRIKAELYSHGFTKETSEEALESLEAEVDYHSNCAALLEKEWGSPPFEPEILPKIAAQMQRYGYSYSDFKKAVANKD